jgi:hypothetical protein
VLTLKNYRVLKDIYVESGPPFILVKGSIIRLYKSPKREKPVTGLIFTDRKTHEAIDKNWKEYLEEAN